MNEIIINEIPYQFRFGMAYIKEMNKRVTIPVQGMQGVSQEVGTRFNIARILDGELEALEEALLLANKTESPRLKQADLEKYLEDENTDIEEVFGTVVGFLERANCTKKHIKDLQAEIEAMKSVQ